MHKMLFRAKTALELRSSDEFNTSATRTRPFWVKRTKPFRVYGTQPLQNSPDLLPPPTSDVQEKTHTKLTKSQTDQNEDYYENQQPTNTNLDPTKTSN
uniref:Uncharacterized protein n=1 Tax=Medicago truncatula TaxID=3880 RepID=Q2HU69_MEDTR|nr:hypothetical protein MtrDRAFT_AC149208g31v2 [Medicago truncatula]